MIRQFLVNQPSDKRILNSFNMLFVLQTQANAKTLQIEQNWEERNEWDHIFFCEILCLFVNLVASTYFCYKRKPSKMGGGIRGISKISISQLFSELGKFTSTAQACFQKTQFSIFIMNWEKLRSSARVTFKNTKIFLWIGNRLEVYPKANAQKSQFRIYGWIGKNYIVI